MRITLQRPRTMDRRCRPQIEITEKLGPEARSDYQEFAGFVDLENVKELPAKKKGLKKNTAMSVFDRAA